MNESLIDQLKSQLERLATYIREVRDVPTSLAHGNRDVYVFLDGVMTLEFEIIFDSIMFDSRGNATNRIHATVKLPKGKGFSVVLMEKGITIEDVYEFSTEWAEVGASLAKLL